MVKKYCNIGASILVLVCLVGAFSAKKICFNNTGDHEGLFLLKGEKGFWYELTDDLFPDESERLIWGRPVTWLKNVVSANQCNASADSRIAFEWDEHTGRGFVKNIYPDGRKLLICLSRFQGYNDIASKGLFVGGNLPPDNPDYNIYNYNETGMAFYDGKRYFHIWCNVNEAMASALNPAAMSYPTQWEFLGSKVLENNGKDLTLSSRHRTLIDGTPYIIEKTFLYETGNSYFTLVTKITNSGDKLASFIYCYGDEPFLGNYGSSKGNVGWLKNGIIDRETSFDTRTNTFAGMFDYGNPLAGEKHEDYTWKANFLEWDHKSPPDVGYFANKEGGIGIEAHKPLSNPENRFIGLQWGPRVLGPKQSFTFSLAIGMAENSPVSGFPVKPVTYLN